MNLFYDKKCQTSIRDPACIRTTRFTDEHVFKTLKILGYVFMTADRSTGGCAITAMVFAFGPPGFY